MRLLADNPSIDDLRREAKDLLGSLREADAATTLAVAQRAVAEEYGFGSWSDLKAEVERRRAALPAAPPGLAEETVAAFGLGATAVVMTPIRYEYMGRRWLVETGRGRFVVCPVFDWIDDAQAEVATDLQERARSAGVRSPVPVRTPGGGLVRRLQDQSWRCFEWMDLGPAPIEPVTADVARSAGTVLAAVHEVAPPTDRPIEGQWVSVAGRPTPAQWAALDSRARAAGCDWADEVAALAPVRAELSAIAAEPDPASVVVTNRDLGPHGVRAGRGDELVVLHWDFAGPMVPAWELATTLFHWTGPMLSNLVAAHALLAGYRGRRGDVPALTLDAFTPVVTGALTWLLHRAWEAADPEPSEQRDFAVRSLRQDLDNPLTVAGLEALVSAAIA